MQKANTEQLLAEYMERFGKKLNEQESRTGDELFMWLKDKLPESYQSGVEDERKRHNWWGNFDNYHAHCINGEHFIGKNPGYGCDECKRVFGTGYTDSLTNQGETK